MMEVIPYVHGFILGKKEEINIDLSVWVYYQDGRWLREIFVATVFETRKEAQDIIDSLSNDEATSDQADQALIEYVNRQTDEAVMNLFSNKAPLENEIRAKCNELAEFLIEKNRAYGNSAAEPMSIFAKRLDKLAQIDVRIDDKLSRLMKGSEYPGDDTIKDLTGYLILRMIVADVDEVRT